MSDILTKTQADALSWKVMRSDDYAMVLPPIDGVRRVAVAEYQLGEQAYWLYFVEAKTKRVRDFGAVSEVSSFEIFVVNRAREVVLFLGEVLVERDDLLRLASLVDGHNEQTKEFFAAFDRSGVA